MPSNRASRDRRKRPVIYLRLLNAKADHVGEGVAQSRVLFHDKRSLHMMKRGQIR